MSEEPVLRKFYINKFLSDQFVKRIKAGLVPWRHPWIGKVPLQNGVSGHRYQGLNVFQLTIASLENDFRQPYWLTRNQIQKRGGEILPEHKQNGTLFVFYRDHPIQETVWTKDPETGELTDERVERTVPLIRYGTLFNIAQCKNLKAADLPACKAGQRAAPAEDRQRAQGVAQRALEFLRRAPGLPVNVALSDAVAEAVYDSSHRAVVASAQAKREGEAAFAFGLFKAVVSATGFPACLDHPGLGGSRDASREDLAAELGAGLLCGRAGIRPPQVAHEGTINAWVKALDADPRLLLRAGIQAQKAVALVLGMRQAQTQTPSEPRPVINTFAKPLSSENQAQVLPEPAAFTAIDVIYRDAANYKQFESYVVQGKLSFRDLEPYLQEGVYFVGRDVQMEDLAFRFVERDGMDLGEGDQPWQAIEALGPTTSESAEQAKGQGRFLGKASDVLERFRRASRANWPSHGEVAAQMKRYVGLDPQAIHDEDQRQNQAIGY